MSFIEMLLVAKVTLSESSITVEEEVSVVEVCVELKSPIKRDISLQLSHHNITAEGRVVLKSKHCISNGLFYSWQWFHSS